MISQRELRLRCNHAALKYLCCCCIQISCAEHLDLERALAQIEPNEAAAITLNLSMGYSHSEISEILEMPPGTVKSHINRGLKKLRYLMLEN